MREKPRGLQRPHPEFFEYLEPHQQLLCSRFSFRENGHLLMVLSQKAWATITLAHKKGPGNLFSCLSTEVERRQGQPGLCLGVFVRERQRTGSAREEIKGRMSPLPAF